MVNSISHNNYGDSFHKDTRKGSHTDIAMTVGRNVGSELEKCFDRQSLPKQSTLVERLEEQERKAWEMEICFQWRMLSLALIKEANGHNLSKFKSGHHGQRWNRWQTCMCRGALVKTEGNVQLLHSLCKKKKI